MNNYEWLDKKTPRSVEQLRLWPANPRLTPDEQHTTLSDYAEDFMLEEADRISFIDLARGIAKKGFIPFDPIIVWQSPDNEKFYVAEGNRRILILKLLRHPDKAPRQYRGLFRTLAEQIDQESISKVMVNVAPSFDESIWYINQRNNNSSLQRSWGRVQQHRWVSDLFEMFNGDIEKIKDITNFMQSDLEGIIRILKIKDFVDKPEISEQLGEEVFVKAKSRNFPITILERLFSIPEVRERWGIEYDGINVKVKSNRKSFNNLFVDLIKKIVQRDTVYKDSPDRITTRTVTTHLKDILAGLPEVNFEKDDDAGNEEQQVRNDSKPKPDITVEEKEPQLTTEEHRALTKNDPNRACLIPNFYVISTTNYRLNGLFEELQKIRLTHRNCVGACLRVLLDLSVLNYINNEGLETSIASTYKAAFRDVQLKKRIEYIKVNKLATEQTKKIAARLLDENSEYSLDVLNGYVHGKDIHYLTKPFLNNFWNFLFPLFDLFLDIKEKDV